MNPSNQSRAGIESSISNARRRVAERVDQIDRKLRGDFDVQRVAAENAPQLVAAGVAAGVVLGYAIPKPLLRVIQIAVPVAIAVVVAKKISEQAACEDPALE